jgi:hypothetical protein
MAKSEYVVTLTIDTTADSPQQAAQDFAEYLVNSGGYTVTVAEFDLQTGRQTEVAQVEIR